jgi:hypothetical protein
VGVKNDVAPTTQESAKQQFSLEEIVMEIEKQGIAEISIYESEEHGMIGKTLIKQLSHTDDFSTNS